MRTSPFAASLIRSFILLLLIFTLPPIAYGAEGRGGPSELKLSQAQIRKAKPGFVFHIYPQIGGAPANAKAYRIVYRSTNLKGEPIAV
ncbi:MAG: hypothetical protein WC829_11800, partial [Hyphomicrobium sp.]